MTLNIGTKKVKIFANNTLLMKLLFKQPENILQHFFKIIPNNYFAFY
jgi:hypothetical protein